MPVFETNFLNSSRFALMVVFQHLKLKNTQELAFICKSGFCSPIVTGIYSLIIGLLKAKEEEGEN